MMTTHELCNVLADALGIGRSVVNAHASAYREAGLFPDDADQALPEHAAALLIALMTGAPPNKSLDACRLYANLPSGCVPLQTTTDDGHLLGTDIAANVR